MWIQNHNLYHQVQTNSSAPMSNSNLNRLDMSQVNEGSQIYEEENESGSEKSQDSLVEDESSSEYDLEEEYSSESEASASPTRPYRKRKEPKRSSKNTTPATSDAEQQSVRGATSSAPIGGTRPTRLGFDVEYRFMIYILERAKKGREFSHKCLVAMLKRIVESKLLACSFHDIELI